MVHRVTDTVSTPKPVTYLTRARLRRQPWSPWSEVTGLNAWIAQALVGLTPTYVVTLKSPGGHRRQWKVAP